MVETLACSSIGQILVQGFFGGIASSVGFVGIIIGLQVVHRKYIEVQQRRQRDKQRAEHYADAMRRQGIKSP